MKGTPFKLKQKLSPKASAAKARREKAAAMSGGGTKKKREDQKKCGPTGDDLDKTSGKCIPRGKNRAKNSRSGAVKKKYNY